MHLRALPPAPAAMICALVLGGCGTTATSAPFKGEQHRAAQVVANLQSAATDGEGEKICTQVLAQATVTKLGGRKGCETAIKHQLALVDNMETSIESVTIAPDGQTASATVRSIYSGKTQRSKVALAKEGGNWRISGP
jgi:Domain of unknown function (DUF4878)